MTDKKTDERVDAIELSELDLSQLTPEQRALIQVIEDPRDSYGHLFDGPLVLNKRHPKSSDELSDEVEEILEGRNDLSADVRNALLTCVADIEEDTPGSLDEFLKVLRERDADFIEEAVQIAEDCDMKPFVIMLHYSHKVRDSLEGPM